MGGNLWHYFYKAMSVKSLNQETFRLNLSFLLHDKGSELLGSAYSMLMGCTFET